MKLERLEEAHQRGVRHAQLVHYTPNDIGDFQTGAVMFESGFLQERVSSELARQIQLSARAGSAGRLLPRASLRRKFWSAGTETGESRRRATGLGLANAPAPWN
jgi:hypothetical protein